MLRVLTAARLRGRQGGFSLLEVLIVVVLLAIVIPALFSGFTASYVLTRDARMLELAKHVSQTIMERALSDRNPQSVTSPTPFSDSLANFLYELHFAYDEVSGRTTITVIVRYPFLQGTREYQTVAVRYGA